MDRFSSLLSNVDCDAGPTLEFKDAMSYQSAHDSFHWVNQVSNRSFVLVTDWPGCGDDGRTPYIVNHITWDNSSFTATLDGSASSWVDALPESSLHFSSSGIGTTALQKRSKPHDYTLSMAQDFSMDDIISETVDGVTVELGCSPCFSTGELDFELEVDNLLKHTGRLSVTPSGLATLITMTLKVSGELDTALETNVPILTIPLDGTNIGDLVKIGPQLVVSVGASMSNWTASAEASFGTWMNISDSSNATIDFKDLTKSSSTSWTPSFTQQSSNLSAQISASGEVYAEIAIDFDLEILGFGLYAGVDLKAPDFVLDFSADASTDGVCGSSGSPVGTDLDIKAGLVAEGSAGVTDETPVVQFTIFEAFEDLFNECIPVNESSDNSSNVTGNGTYTLYKRGRL